MLRRDRQIRMQIHQLLDACLFAISFWLAYVLRSNPELIDLFSLPPVNPFEDYVWLYLLVIPAAPVILETQGFYTRPMLGSRRTTAWQLSKACLITVLGLILVLFFFKMIIARSVIIWFGFISFFLVMIKEELLRMAFRSNLAKSQYLRRFILVGTSAETTRMKAELDDKSRREMDVVSEVDLHQTSISQFVALLHELSVNGVIISTKHSYFEQVEEVIHACELEGVEAWLVADFFKTQISRTSFDDFHGHPVLVFRTTPEASWQSVMKQLLDFFGALALLILLSGPLFSEATNVRTRAKLQACTWAGPAKFSIFLKSTPRKCKRNIEMTPLCNIEVTLPRVLGSREVRRGGGVVDEQAGVQPS